MDDRPFAGHTALVTGAARRIGRTIATRLATLGANVVVHHHTSAADAHSLCADLRTRRVQAWPVRADLSDPAAVEGLLDDARGVAGREVDLIINNAASFPKSTLEDLTWEGLSEAIRTDAWAPFELTRALGARYGKLKGRSKGAAVVNLIDTRIADYDWEHAGYILAKRLLADLTRMSAIRFAPHVTVNGVAPGPTLPAAGMDRATFQRLAKHLPLRRTPTPDDIADAVLYLLGNRSVTGQVIHVDGGRHLGKAVYE